MSDLVVGVAGASGALGTEILAALERAPWSPDEVRALARSSTKVPFVRYKEEQVSVDDLDLEALDHYDVLFLALPADAARQAGEAAIREGVAVVDCSGAFDDESVPMVVPWVNPEALAQGHTGVLGMPSPAALLLASVLGPLRRAGIGGQVDATVLLPASVSGRDGVEELSRQVVSLFNSATPPRKVFPEGLAFDIIPQVGGDAGDGVSSFEARTADEVERILGLRPNVTAVQIPVFSGVSAAITLRSEQRLMPELLAQILQDGGVQVPDGGSRTLPRPRRVDGQPFAQVGRIRSLDEGQTLQLWASMDNLRGSATVAVALGGLLARNR